MKKITIEDIDALTGDIILELFPSLPSDSDKHDMLYTRLHNYLKEWLDPWREGK